MATKMAEPNSRAARTTTKPFQGEAKKLSKEKTPVAQSQDTSTPAQPRFHKGDSIASNVVDGKMEIEEAVTFAANYSNKQTDKDAAVDIPENLPANLRSVHVGQKIASNEVSQEGTLKAKKIEFVANMGGHRKQNKKMALEDS